MRLEINMAMELDKFQLHLSKTKALTGHIYYMSPYECYDNCGTCDGAKCHICHTVFEYSVFDMKICRDTFAEILIRRISEAGGYLPDYTTISEWHEKYQNSLDSQLNQISFEFLQEVIVITTPVTGDAIFEQCPSLFDDIYIIHHKGKGYDDGAIAFKNMADAKLMMAILDCPDLFLQDDLVGNFDPNKLHYYSHEN